jgi:hypothetical protein
VSGPEVRKLAFTGPGLNKNEIVQHFEHPMFSDYVLSGFSCLIYLDIRLLKTRTKVVES